MASTVDFTQISELPGHGATDFQLSALYTRYAVACDFAENRDVLEVAVGSGFGLGLLAEKASRVVGDDLDPGLVAIARETYADRKDIEVMQLDAQRLPFDENEFDLVLLYEAIYYLPQPKRFVEEAKRVLRPGGQLLICTANCEWDGFNPSPHSHRYFSAMELADLLAGEGFEPSIYGAFPVENTSGLRNAVRYMRAMAVRMNLIPRTQKGKELYKRIFYGRLTPLPRVLHHGAARREELVALDPRQPQPGYIVLYAIGSLSK